jgi:hypothetical protein
MKTSSGATVIEAVGSGSLEAVIAVSDDIAHV